ncbi:MAG: hypothetical protein AAB296_00315 [Candidatus Desantisbacteria bacterium]
MTEQIKKVVEKNGGGSFLYCELKTHNQFFIDDIQSAETTEELKQIWNLMQEKAFLSYRVDAKDINDNISEFEALSLDDQKKFLIEVLDKNMLYVNYCDIDDMDYNISKEDKKLNQKFYGG